MTTVTADLFIEEIKLWKLTDKSPYKIRVMQLGENFYFKFHIPNSTEILETAMTKDAYETFAILELSPISVPGTWQREETQLNEIKKKLEELHATIASPNIGQSILS
jgi:hypothetical protein